MSTITFHYSDRLRARIRELLEKHGSYEAIRKAAEDGREPSVKIMRPVLGPGA